jgi:hypothetical protein
MLRAVAKLFALAGSRASTAKGSEFALVYDEMAVPQQTQKKN